MVEGVLSTHGKKYLEYHDLKTRKAGPMRFIDLHLTVCAEQTVQQAHEVCDLIEADIEKKFKETTINIHMEPCDNHEKACAEICRFYEGPKKLNYNKE